MALTSIQIGRTAQAFAKKESTFGTVPSLGATDAFRHRSLTFPGSDVKNRRGVMVKQQSPWGVAVLRTDQRTTGSFQMNTLLWPSGTLNTLCDVDPFLECGFGTVTNTTLSTTVNAGTGAVGGATLASGTGAAVGLPVLIVCPDGKKRARFLTSVAGAVVTWAPNLPAGQQPADGAAVKLGVLYKPSIQLTLSLAIAYFTRNVDNSIGMARALSGAIIEKLSMDFDANENPMLTCSGPAKLLDTAGAPAHPGAFTTVGTLPPSGITGEFLIDNTAAKMMKMQIEINNSLRLRNESYGYSSAEESYRIGRGTITVGIDRRAESETDLYDKAEAGTNAAIFLQTGFTEGNIVAVRLPQVEFPVPDTDDPDEEINFPFKGIALESTDSALDALQLGLL